eukprot:TRINITY_DN13853_c0_g1_i2.p1 TRINITY_DN13853_c0_g1~~TRINITY_DN13853_c0_g1_i2.p1  ORF type:complete len:339 (+),score=59.43 TRINITY_DN13853_c0_g1_i2:223-1239(+)
MVSALMSVSGASLLLFACFATSVQCAGQRKIYAAGSGLDMLSLPETVSEIITLSGKSKPAVLYLGTATYDDTASQNTQTQSFLNAGCAVHALQLAVNTPTPSEMQAAFQAADVVLVSGGNTLYATDRFAKLGITALMKEAMSNGTVLCGGSAGGIVWFDGGHSDSMEAASYKNPPGPFLNPNMSKEEMANWAYIRVNGLSVIPGLFCPHYDMTESNGVLRSSDFTGLLQRHSGEKGIGVDNWGSLMIDGDAYTIVSRAGKPGSVKDGAFTTRRDGVPGAWQMHIDPADGQLVRQLVPSRGLVSDLLIPAKYIVESNMLGVARAQNPDDGKKPSLVKEL